MDAKRVANDGLVLVPVSNALSDWARLANEVNWPGALWSALADDSARAVLASKAPAWNTPERVMALGGRWPRWVASFPTADGEGRYGVFNPRTHETISREVNELIFGPMAQGPARAEARALAQRAAAMWPEWERLGGEHALDRAWLMKEFVEERSLFGNATKVVAPYAGVGELVSFGLLPGRASALGPGWAGTLADGDAKSFAKSLGDSARVGAGRFGKALEAEEVILSNTKPSRVAQALAPFVATLPFFTVSELARRSDVSYNSAANVLTDLERAKIVERSRPEKDGGGVVFTSKVAKELYATAADKLPSATAAALAWTRKVARVPALQDAVPSLGLVKRSATAAQRHSR